MENNCTHTQKMAALTPLIQRLFISMQNADRASLKTSMLTGGTTT